MKSILKNAKEVTIFRDRESGSYSFSDGIKKIADVNTAQFEMVYRFLGEHVKMKVEEILKNPVIDPNVQEVLKRLFNHKTIC